MLPIVDMHCHLLAGLDDGPREETEALEMCRILAGQGAGSVLALAHQNEMYPGVTPDGIRRAIALLRGAVRTQGIALDIFPGAEVMIHPALMDDVRQGKYLTIASTGKYILIEFPHGLYIDLREIVADFMRLGIRPILAHPEQCPDLLFSEHAALELVQIGCLFQLSTGNVAVPNRRAQRAIKSWVQRGLVHVIGSDGHSPQRRPPLLAEAAQTIASWAGTAAADRICGMNALAILQGLPLRLPPPQRSRSVKWFLSRLLKK